MAAGMGVPGQGEPGKAGRNVRRSGRFRNEVVLGTLVVLLLSSLVTWGGIQFWSRRDFDSMVKKSDVEIAGVVAASLAQYYESHGSWDEVEAAIRLLPLYRMEKEAGSSGEAELPLARLRDSGRTRLALVLTDARGMVIFDGFARRDRPKLDDDDHLPPRPFMGPYDVGRGVAVASAGRPVGYVFYKSMLVSTYNLHEQEYAASLWWAIGLSVLVGAGLAVVLGTVFAARLARPVAALDHAVQQVAAGNHRVRVPELRHDELGNLARNFNAMAGSLEQAEQARQNMIADIAHELRTPVSIIQANLEMMMEGIYAPDPARLQGIYDETRILADLIGDLRSLSDLDSGQAAVQLEPVDLGELTAAAVTACGPLFAEKGVGLVAEAPGGAAAGQVLALADGDWMRQVLRNILTNACKYAPAGSRVTVRVGRTPAGGVRLAVADEGPGVPPQDTERIFERFFRVDASRNRESGGRGLGLAICKQFVERCGGRIGAVNRQPAGLEVWFELPGAPKA